MNGKKENKTMTNSNEVAFYEVMKDSYNQRYKIRSLLFKRVLKHMIEKMREESAIYYLMQEVKSNRK